MRLPRHAETRCAIDKFTHGIYLSEATSAQALQPDLIGVFRIFAGARVFIAAFFLLAATLALGRVMLFAFLPLVTSIALLAFVMSRRLQARLGPWHMKLAGLFATADVLLTTDFYMRWSIAHWIFPAAHMPDVPQFIKSLTSIAFAFDQGTPPISPLLVTISLLVLLIIISWRQELRYSITYIVVTTAIDIGIMLVVSSGLVQIAFNLAVIFCALWCFASSRPSSPIW